MRISSWAPFLGAFFAALASAEPDGAVAEPGRWTGPNGPPSNSRWSRALPVTRDVVAAWTLALPGEAVAPPVTWDGVAYLLCAAGADQQLVAVDVRKGTLIARKLLPGAPAAPIHVWGDVVYVFSRPNQISGFRPIGSSFVEKWKVTLPGEGKEGSGHTMAVFEGEMYVVTDECLLRASPGLKDPLWKVPGNCRGPAAIYGDTVLAVSFDKYNVANLVSYDRSTGMTLGHTELGMPSSVGQRTAPVEITAGAADILVRTPWALQMVDGTASDVFVGYSFEDNRLRNLAATAVLNFRVKAAVYKGGIVSCESETEWHWWRGNMGRVLADRQSAPDLFKTLVPPTVVGNVIYFGTWAADVETNEILWRLPLRSVRFGVVPADRLLLALDGEGKLWAFKSRVGQ